ncbi:hypothetical protein ABVT39_019172 [Epinephelus coioides]
MELLSRSTLTLEAQVAYSSLPVLVQSECRTLDCHRVFLDCCEYLLHQITKSQGAAAFPSVLWFTWRLLRCILPGVFHDFQPRLEPRCASEKHRSLTGIKAVILELRGRAAAHEPLNTPQCAGSAVTKARASQPLCWPQPDHMTRHIRNALRPADGQRWLRSTRPKSQRSLTDVLLRLFGQVSLSHI